MAPLRVCLAEVETGVTDAVPPKSGGAFVAGRSCCGVVEPGD